MLHRLGWRAHWSTHLLLLELESLLGSHLLRHWIEGVVWSKVLVRWQHAHADVLLVCSCDLLLLLLKQFYLLLNSELFHCGGVTLEHA